jgi:hypothetical protein
VAASTDPRRTPPRSLARNADPRARPAPAGRVQDSLSAKLRSCRRLSRGPLLFHLSQQQARGISALIGECGNTADRLAKDRRPFDKPLDQPKRLSRNRE